MTIKSEKFSSLMDDIRNAETPETYAEARQALMAYVDGYTVGREHYAVEVFKTQCRAAGLVAVDNGQLTAYEGNEQFHLERSTALDGSDIAADGPEFTIKASEPLNELLNNTAMLLKGPANHDVGMMWYESLEAVLELLAQAQAVDFDEDEGEYIGLAEVDNEAELDVAGRLIKLLADHCESNKFELLLGGMTFEALCEDGEPPLIVLTSVIEEEFNVSLEAIGEESLETLTSVIAEKLNVPKPDVMSHADIEAKLLATLGNYLPRNAPGNWKEFPINEVVVGELDQEDLLDELSVLFNTPEFDGTRLLLSTEDLIDYIEENQ